MPVKSHKQYSLMQASAHGRLRGIGPSPDVAKEFVKSTPAKKRRKFSKSLAKKRA